MEQRCACVLRVLALVVVAGGCSDPQLVLPQPVALTGRFGEEKLEPVSSVRLQLGVEPAESSVRWKASAASEWIRLAVEEGGAPIQIDVHFDLSKMQYGDNASTLAFEVGKQRLSLPVSYRLEGALTIEPARSLELTGRVGEPATKPIELRLTSLGKDGLPWKLRFDDPWLGASSVEGSTPSAIQVSASLAQLTQSVTGRLTIEAPLAWRGSPIVLPVSTTILDVALVRKQVDAKRKKLDAERAALSKELEAWLENVDDDASIDELHTRMRNFGKEADAMTARLLPLFDELEAFLVQMKAYETECDFPKVRAELATARAELEKGTKVARAVSKAVRLVREDIASTTEWQRVKGIQLGKGDTIYAECEGEWLLGAFAGTCDAEGSDGYEDSRIIRACPFGCLMIRAGDELLLVGDGSGEVMKTGGRLEARCNDSDYSNNAGSIRLSVLVIPNPDTLVK